jgi:hypothetical protein
VESGTMCSIAGKFRLAFYSLKEICEGAFVASAVGCVSWTGENITIGSCRWWLLLVLFQYITAQRNCRCSSANRSSVSPLRFKHPVYF